jgi:CubicO group peptidase (beta-lactamase class C family)
MTWNSLRALCRPGLFLLLAGLLLCLSACGGSSHSTAGATATVTSSRTVFFPGDTPVPATGPAVPGVEAYDREMSALLKRWNVPGAAVAVARRGKLVLARGYGYADFEAQQLMQPRFHVSHRQQFQSADRNCSLATQGTGATRP